MTHRFDDDTAVTSLGGSTWAGEIRPGWRAIGGQPNGGYVLALALAAVAEAIPGTRPFSVTAHYVRPAEIGPAEIDVDIVKLGQIKNTVEARLSQGGKERLRLLTALGHTAPEGALATFTVPPPDLPKPDECLLPPAGAASGEADIADRFDYRVTPDTRWLTGITSDTAHIEGWIRFCDGREPDTASLPLFADAFPPAIYEVVESALVPTVELTVHIRQRPVPGWLQVRFQSRLLAGGVLEEDGEMWDSEGRLVAMSRQLAFLLPLPNS